MTTTGRSRTSTRRRGDPLLISNASHELLRELSKHKGLRNPQPDRFAAFLNEHAALLFLFGFDEIRAAPGWRVSWSATGTQELADPNPDFASGFQRLRFRQAATGVWYGCNACGIMAWREGQGFEYGFRLVAPGLPDFYVGTAELLLSKYDHTPLPDIRGAWVQPSFWKVPEEGDSIAVVSTTQELLDKLRSEQVHLAQLHWRQMEEIVAELLRAKGMEIELTKPAKDGGRDIIARGELVPGEPMVLAVEVKHKDVVGVADLRAALEANRDFPALLFATSGRFTAGVLAEKAAADRRLRVILKDGVGLNQWIMAGNPPHR